jgi:hypothetical protein
MRRSASAGGAHQQNNAQVRARTAKEHDRWRSKQWVGRAEIGSDNLWGDMQARMDMIHTMRHSAACTRRGVSVNKDHYTCMLHGMSASQGEPTM